MDSYEQTRQASERAIAYIIAHRPQSSKPFPDDELAVWFEALSDDDKDKVMFYAIVFVYAWGVGA